ncbi:hypothetical protein LEN26_016796 [Aphanomyces euteiches]|nr:hypothetical protein LEN26_016796 [Aphanomyces euteiches]KAH9129840.1 hypothetical protein AeMF1_000106 [Aphanomyces euteiches]KAH9190257.1 hypothetical protein AeNC1_007763 [Aphanomyces euteiches]
MKGLLLSSLAAAVAATSSHSFGTLVECTSSAGCVWMGKNDKLVNGERMLHEMLVTHHRGDDYETAKRNLQGHIDYIEAIYTHADEMNHEMSMRMGVNPRNLFEDPKTLGKPLDVVLLNIQGNAAHRRLLASYAKRELTESYPASLNWCTTNNPRQRSVCADVKSQQQCGSCWAFAATDVIETAVSLATNNTPVSLSSQQLLSCSTSSQVNTFDYCFAQSGSIPKWLETSMRWDSKNQGCSGGMTHIALSDAVKLQNLATRIEWPYVDQSSSTSSGPVAPTSSTRRLTNSTSNTTFSCSEALPIDKTAAHISGWVPALDKDSCKDGTKDPIILLKRALVNGPLAVAVNAQNGFKNFKSGSYTCGSITSSDMIDHALLLVGYDSSDADGNYWILKNSYGADWGLKGYINIKQDNGLNCGLNVFPVRVLGASSGPGSTIVVDGGGSLTFAGMSMWTWVVVGAITGVATVVLTIVGVMVARKRMSNMHL